MAAHCMNLSTSCILSAAKLVQAITSSPWFSAIVTLTHLLIPSCFLQIYSSQGSLSNRNLITSFPKTPYITHSIGDGFGWTPGFGDGQGGLACCSSWGHKESDTTDTELNWTEWLTIVKLSNWLHLSLLLSFVPSLAIHVLLCFPYTLNSFQRP